MSKKMTILVVDVDPAFRESVANLLLLCGIDKFQVAADAEEALEKISHTFFDIVLIDLFMPEMNGVQLARKCKERIPKANIILLIEDNQESILDRAGQAELGFPTLLKSFVSDTLPQLLAERPNSMSHKA